MPVLLQHAPQSYLMFLDMHLQTRYLSRVSEFPSSPLEVLEFNSSISKDLDTLKTILVLKSPLEIYCWQF